MIQLAQEKRNAYGCERKSVLTFFFYFENGPSLLLGNDESVEILTQFKTLFTMYPAQEITQ